MAAPVIQQHGAGSQFIGCPAVYQITPTGAGTSKTFYRMKVKVVVGMTGYDDMDFNFSTPIEVRGGTSQNTYFDISSALRAIADQWQPAPSSSIADDNIAAPQSFTYPAITFYMEAEEEWMNDGAISHSDTARYPGSAPSVATMYMGTLTDRERLAATPSPPAAYSRKPTTAPEICFYHPNQQGQPDGTSKHLHPGICNNNGSQSAPSVTPFSVGSGLAAATNTYGIPYPQDGHEIRFINSLGVHENIFVAGHPTKEVNITTEKYTISRQETLTQFSRGLAIKQNDHETWKFSSGPLDEAWASWYIHEFLMARWVWIGFEPPISTLQSSLLWVPCHILPEETTPIVDREHAGMLEVPFKLQLDINGSPL